MVGTNIHDKKDDLELSKNVVDLQNEDFGDFSKT